MAAGDREDFRLPASGDVNPRISADSWFPKREMYGNLGLAKCGKVEFVGNRPYQWKVTGDCKLEKPRSLVVRLLPNLV